MLHHAVLTGFEDLVDLLLRRGASVNAVHTEKGTPLCLAVEKERSRIAARLMQARADVNRTADNKITPLHWASAKGDTETMKLLIDRGAKVDIVVDTRSMRDPKAPSSSKPEVFKNHFRSALSLAAEYGHHECVRLLCDHGALKSSTVHLGQLPLLFAAQNGHDECVQLLLTNGVDPNVMEHLDLDLRYGTYALLVAISRTHSNVVRSLYQAGARRDVTAKDGTSILNILLREKFEQIRLGARSQRRTPRDIMESIDMGHMYSYLNKLMKWLPVSMKLDITAYEMHVVYEAANDRGTESDTSWRNLLDLGANIDSTDSTGSAALFLAVANGSLIASERLLQAGARVDIPVGCVERLPLWEAVMRGNLEAVTKILQHKATPNIKDFSNWTPLHEAASQGRTEIIKALVKAGAELSSRDSRNRTPLGVAAGGPTIEVLIELGADPADVNAATKLVYPYHSPLRNSVPSVPRKSVSHEELLRRVREVEESAEKGSITAQVLRRARDHQGVQERERRPYKSPVPLKGTSRNETP